MAATADAEEDARARGQRFRDLRPLDGGTAGGQLALELPFLGSFASLLAKGGLRTCLAVCAALAALLLLSAAAQAQAATVTSFDGTKIHVNFFPAAALGQGHRAATVMLRPGWSQPGDTNQNDAADPTTGIPASARFVMPGST